MMKLLTTTVLLIALFHFWKTTDNESRVRRETVAAWNLEREDAPMFYAAVGSRSQTLVVVLTDPAGTADYDSTADSLSRNQDLQTELLNLGFDELKVGDASRKLRRE
jgi:hypothetical protein